MRTADSPLQWDLRAMRLLATRRVAVSALVLCSLFASCRPTPPDPDVLAHYDGGQIRVAELDTYLLSLPQARRLPPRGNELQPWLTERLGELFEQRQLTTPERLEQLTSDEAFQQAWRQQARGILARAFFRQHAAETVVAVEEAQAYYDAHRREFQSPERRLIRNLLLAFPPGATAAQQQEVCARAEALRVAIVAGASFEELARQHSTSSSAASGGNLGVLARADLRADMAEVIFQLQPGQVSSVVRGATGCQLFVVQQITPAIDARFVSVQEALIQRLRGEKQMAHFRTLIQEQARLLNVTLPDWAGLVATIGLEPDLFTFEGERVTSQAVTALIRQGVQPTSAVEQLVGEVIASSALRRQDPARVEALLAPAYTAAATAYLRRRTLLERLDAVPVEELRQGYEAQKVHFMTDPQLEVTVYSWPIGPGDPVASMPRPEAFATALRAAGTAPDSVWATFREDTGVEREDVPLTSLRVLPGRRPALAGALVKDVREGEVVGPFRYQTRLYVYRVRTYIPARQLSFLEAREQLLAEYARREGERLLREWGAERREALRYAVIKANLPRFGERLLEQLQGG